MRELNHVYLPLSSNQIIFSNVSQMKIGFLLSVIVRHSYLFAF